MGCRETEARQCAKVFFMDPDDKEFEETTKNARGQLELPMEAAMPFKLKTTKSSFRHRVAKSESKEIQKSKHACIVEAHESTRKRLEKTPPKDHEDHIAAKGFNSLSHKKFCA